MGAGWIGLTQRESTTVTPNPAPFSFSATPRQMGAIDPRATIPHVGAARGDEVAGALE